MNNLTPETTVGTAVADNMKRVKVFQHHGIDFCCGGKATLAAAASKKGLAVEDLISDLIALDRASNATQDQSWNDRSVADLVGHILVTYHDPLRSELPRLHQMLKKIAAVHGDSHPELRELFNRFTHFEREMYDHMAKEENILFPLCVDLERGTVEDGAFCGSVNGPIRVMMMEHDDAAAFFSHMNRLTNDLQPPDGACTTYRASFDGLRDLEQEMHLHIHLENNVLFPRAAALEEASRTCSSL